jgi:hypothetical protein
MVVLGEESVPIPNTGCAVMSLEVDENGAVTGESVNALVDSGELDLRQPDAVASIGYIGKCACGETYLVSPGSPRRFPSDCPLRLALDGP